MNIHIKEQCDTGDEKRHPSPKISFWTYGGNAVSAVNPAL
jgi:hypothetical protein